MRRCCAVALTLLLSAMLSAQIVTTTSGNGHLFVEPTVGVLYGELGEYVYEKDGNGDYQKLSYLQWQEHPIVLYGLMLGGEYQRVFARFSVQSGLPLRCGDMEDSDWMRYDSMKTTYSISENTAEAAVQLALQVGYTFQPVAWLSLSPLAGVTYRYRHFAGQDGYGWYGHYQTPMVAWDDPAATFYDHLGKVTYARHSVSPCIGGTVQFALPHRVTIAVSGTIAPYTYIESTDRHYYTNGSVASEWLDIEHVVFGSVQGAVGVYYACTSAVDIGLTLSGTANRMVQGKTYQLHADGIYYESSVAKSGADTYEAQLVVSCRVHVF